MATDVELLIELNINIGRKEADGDADFFNALLAPAFAMRRASGQVSDRYAFLTGVAKSPERTTETPSVMMHGDSRAIVTCIVSMGTGTEIKRFHNLRLFTRSGPGREWQLLAWANELIPGA